MRFTLTVEIDDAKADAFNASMFDPDDGDQVQGSGRSLVLGIIEDCGIDEILDPCGLVDCVTRVEADLDGIPLANRYELTRARSEA